MPTKSTLYLKPVGGLCNRMRTIDSCVALANQLNKELIVFWGRDNFLNCSYSDLFQLPSNYEVIEEKLWFGKKAPIPYLPGSRPTSALKTLLYNTTKQLLGIQSEIWFEEFDIALEELRASITPDKIKHISEFDEQAATLLKPFIKNIAKTETAFICTAWRFDSDKKYNKNFRPTEKLQYCINTITQQFTDTIGLHIRRTDHIWAIQNSELVKFKTELERAINKNKDKTFFLATDCPKTEAELLTSYRNRIIIYPKNSLNRNTPEGIKDALIDLYCLSGTKKIFGSYFSSFSQVASEISGIKEYTIV